MEIKLTPDEQIGPQTVLFYFVASVLMLGLVVTAYNFYIQQQRAEREANFYFAEGLDALFKKRDVVADAKKDVADLRRDIGALPITPADKERLTNQAITIDERLRDVQTIIQSAVQRIETYKQQHSHGAFSIGLIGSAYAADRKSSISQELKQFIVAAAFLAIVAVIAYCLYLIAAKGVAPANKKWAQQTLNTQLSFLGGVVGGILTAT